MIVVFEGPDGCGKTTLVREVKKFFEFENTRTVDLHMPIRTESRFIGTHLKEGGLAYEAQMESLMQQRTFLHSYFSSSVGSPDEHVVISRWFPSTFVYGTIDFTPKLGRERSMDLLTSMGKFSPVPDIGIIIMPTDPKVLIERILNRESEAEKKDIYERKEETIMDAYNLYSVLVDDIKNESHKYEFCTNYEVYSGDFRNISIEQMTKTCTDMIMSKIKQASKMHKTKSLSKRLS